MEKKSSDSVAIFGWIEIGIGAIGSIFFFFTVVAFVNSFYKLYVIDLSGQAFALAMSQFELSKLGIVVAVPFIFMLIIGRGLLKLNSLARKMNITLLPLLLVFALAYCIHFFNTGNIIDPNVVVQIILDRMLLFQTQFVLLTVAILLLKFRFLTSPEVEEQFKEEPMPEKAYFRNVFEPKLKSLLGSLDDSQLPQLKARLNEMREYATQRHDYYDSYRSRYVTLGIGIIAFAIVLIPYVASFARTSPAIIKVFFALGLASLFFTGGILIWYYIVATSGTPPYRKFAETISWYYKYNIDPQLRTNKFLLSKKEFLRATMDTARDFLKYCKDWVEMAQEDRRFILEDLEQVYVLFALQSYKRTFSEHMAKVFQLGISIAAILFILGFSTLIFT